MTEPPRKAGVMSHRAFTSETATDSTGASSTASGERLGLGPPAALAELARIDLRRDDLSQVLDRIAHVAKASIPGADEVSVSLIGAGAGGKSTTPAFTGDLALEADERQYAEASGPCVEAALGGQVVRVDDMAGEQRWPGYIPGARRAGVRSSISVPLPVQEAVTGALNVYARQPHAFDDDAVEIARTLASYAAVALANAQLYESTAALAHQMQEAMATRSVIEQAKGVIMGQRRCTADEAFQVLVKASSRSNRKLRDIAAEIVEAATAPGRPGRAGR